MSGVRLWRCPPPGRRRLGLMLAVVTAVALAAPAGGFAHVRTGTIAVDYRASVAAPGTRAYAVGITQADHTLTLSITPDHVVVVLGYLSEPMIRLDRDGTWINATSPTARAVGLLARAQFNDGAGERWILHSHRDTVSWRDSRAQQLPAGVTRSAWAIPLLVDAHHATLRGRLTRYPAPAVVPWALLLVGLLGCGAGLVLLRRLEVTRAAALGCAGVGALACPVLALGFAFDANASPGTWIEGFNEIVFVVVGVVALVRGRTAIRAGAAIGLGLVSLAVGLLDSPVFLHPVVLSLWPGPVTRLLVVMAAGAGLVAIGLGGLGFADLLHASLEDVTAGTNRAYS